MNCFCFLSSHYHRLLLKLLIVSSTTGLLLLIAFSVNAAISSSSFATEGAIYLTEQMEPILSQNEPATNVSLFSNATSDANLNVNHRTLTPLGINMMISGAAVGDFNQDGRVDLFVLGGGTASDTLHMNNGDGTFREEAALRGLHQKQRGSGVSVGDFNRDGWPDIFVTSHGTTTTSTIGKHRLYRNNGNGTLIDVAVAAGVNQSNSVSADGFGSVFGDYNLDGHLDLFVTGWKDGESGSRLFRNNGDETFTDVTEDSGLSVNELRGFSPCFADMDGDRYPELLVAGDFDTSKYYINNGDGTFVDATESAGVNKPAFGMGSTVNDMDNDGLLDWYITSIIDQEMMGEGNRLYINQGNHLYAEVAAAAGVDNGYWGWGTAAVDLNHDGWLDIVETNGWTEQPRFDNLPNRIWLNNGDGTFSDDAEASGFGQKMNGRGLLTFDFDYDGDQDIVITTNNGALHLYENELSGTGNHWLKIDLDTSERPDLAPNGIGAKVEISVNGQQQFRHVNTCSSYLSQSESTLHFGVGAADVVDSLIVTWPDGQQTTQTNLATNSMLTIAAPHTSQVPIIATHIIHLPLLMVE